MTLTLQLPENAESILKGAYGTHLNRAVLEAMAAEGYRTAKLSHFEVQQLLGFDNRWDTDKWLADKQLYMHYTVEDLHEDRATIAKLME